MKNRLFGLAAKSAAMVMFAFSSAFGFSEGEDYAKLANPIPNADKTLVKIFSYDCPFCYKYDKSVTPIVVKKLEGVLKFKPFHLKTKGKYGNEASELFAALIVKDADNGVKDFTDDKSLFKKAKMAYYEAYHDKKERWDGGADPFLATGLEACSLSKNEFESLKSDTRVKELLNSWEVGYDIAKIQGVPAFVVNGKYLIFTKNIKSVEGMVELIKELAVK